MTTVLKIAARDPARVSRASLARVGEKSSIPIRVSAATPIKVIMLGPALDVMGGIASVERLIVSAVPSDVKVRQIATMRDGSSLRKACTFAVSVCKLLGALRSKPDVVHIHFASGASSLRKMILASLAQRAGANVVLHAHGGFYRKHWERMGARERALTRGVFENVKGLIVLGEGWRDFFASVGVPRDRIVVLPNPVVVPPNIPVRSGSAKVNAVYLGLMNRMKGTFDLVEAVARLPRATRDRLHLVIAGNGETHAVESMVQEHGLNNCIEVRGWQSADERDALLAQSEIFLLPSYFEGLPMAMLEAMAWGLAPICSSVGSIGEVIAPERNGMLVSAGNVDGLVNAIAELVLDDRKRALLGANARSSVAPLAVDHYIERLVKVYSRAAQAQSIAELSVTCKR